MVVMVYGHARMFDKQVFENAYIHKLMVATLTALFITALTTVVGGSISLEFSDRTSRSVFGYKTPLLRCNETRGRR